MSEQERRHEHAPDLAAFARPAAATRTPSRGPRRWTRLLLLAIVAGCFALLGERALDAFRPKKPVTIVRPAPSSSPAAATEVAAQVASFIEADPFPTVVTPLVAGVFASIRVQSGDAIAAGDVLATIDDAEAKLALAEAEADVAAKHASRDSAQKRKAIAIEAHERAIDLEAALVQARADRAGQQQNATERAAAVAGAVALRDAAAAALEREREFAKDGAAGPRQVEIETAKLAAAEAASAAARAESALAASLADKAAATVDQAEKNLASKFALADRRAEAEGAAEEAAAAERAAAARRDAALLRLDRTVLRAPSAGVVQSVLVRPGDPAAPQAPAFVTFDPARLRARADVPLAALARVRVGQKALVRPEGGSRAFAGEVRHVTAEADVQKVTLRVHVALLEADAELVPERLCQVQLLGADGAAKQGESRSGAVVIPRSALRQDGSVLVLDRSLRKAERRVVTVGESIGDGVVVTSGINLSDKVIVTPDVEPGDLVAAEDSP